MAKEPAAGKPGRKAAGSARPAEEQPPPPRRAWAARSLAALLPNVTAPAFRRRSPTGARLLACWADVVGPAIAAQSTPRKLSAGTLTIACRGPVAMELQHRAEMLVARINTWSGESLVARLRFVQDPTAGTSTLQPRPHRVEVPPCTLSHLPEGPLRSALEALGTGIGQEQAQQRRPLARGGSRGPQGSR